MMDSWSASRALADSWSVWASKAKLQQDKRRAERGTLSLAHVDGEQRRGPDGCRGRLSENTSMGTAPFVPSDWCNPLAIAAGMLQDFCEIKIRAQEMLAVLNTMLNHSLSVVTFFFGACRRRTPEGYVGSEGSIGKHLIRQVFRWLQIGRDPQRSPSACSEVLVQTRSVLRIARAVKSWLRQVRITAVALRALRAAREMLLASAFRAWASWQQVPISHFFSWSMLLVISEGRHRFEGSLRMAFR